MAASAAPSTFITFTQDRRSKGALAQFKAQDTALRRPPPRSGPSPVTGPSAAYLPRAHDQNPPASPGHAVRTSFSSSAASSLAVHIARTIQRRRKAYLLCHVAWPLHCCVDDIKHAAGGVLLCHITRQQPVETASLQTFGQISVTQITLVGRNQECYAATDPASALAVQYRPTLADIGAAISQPLVTIVVWQSC